MENSELYRAVDPLEGTMRKAMRQEGALMELMQRESEPLELDCSTDLLPSPGGRKATVMADGNTITKHLFDHYRLAMYSHLNRALRNGTLSDVVGFKILDGVINRQVCRFPIMDYDSISVYRMNDDGEYNLHNRMELCPNTDQYVGGFFLRQAYTI